MTTRGPVARALIGLGLSCSLILALASGLVLHGSALVVVCVVAALAAGVSYGARHEHSAAAVAAAGQAAAGVVGVIMIVTGAEVVGGGATVALVIGLAAVVGGAVWLPRIMQARSAQTHRFGAAGSGQDAPYGAPLPPAGVMDRTLPPVALLPTIALGREWSRTSAALRSRLEPEAQQMFVLRRQDVLDELERRDPVGFARWLVTAPDGGSDPAGFVRGGRTRGSDAT